MATFAADSQRGADSPPDSRPRYARLLSACAHPVRNDLLNAFDGGVASPTELAARIKQPVPHVVHHVRRLVELGCVELTERRVVAGTVRRFYRRVENPWLEHEDFEPFGPVPRRRLIENSLPNLLTDVERASGCHAIGDPADFHVERRAMQLDDAGWAELDQHVGSFVEDIQAIAEGAAARLAASDGRAEPLPTFTWLLKFRAGPHAPGAEAGERAEIRT